MTAQELDYCANMVLIDAIRSIIIKIIPCDKIDPQEIKFIDNTFGTIRKELNDSFEVEDKPEPILTEEKMGGDMQDEEADVQQEKPLNFEGIH